MVSPPRPAIFDSLSSLAGVIPQSGKRRAGACRRNPACPGVPWERGEGPSSCPHSSKIPGQSRRWGHYGSVPIRVDQWQALDVAVSFDFCPLMVSFEIARIYGPCDVVTLDVLCHLLVVKTNLVRLEQGWATEVRVPGPKAVFKFQPADSRRTPSSLAACQQWRTRLRLSRMRNR
jgi:hypothetical protein